MNPRKEILDELTNISPALGELPMSGPFEAPAGYFDQFPDRMLALVKSREQSPDNEQDEEILSPLMASLRSKPVFTAPEGYFEQFSQNILREVQSPAIPAKVISMRLVFYKKMMAVAAVLAVIALGGWFFFQPSGKTGHPLAAASSTLINDTVLHAQAHVIPESEIISYLDSSQELNDEDDQLIDTDPSADLATLMLSEVSDEELQNYVDQSYAF